MEAAKASPGALQGRATSEAATTATSSLSGSRRAPQRLLSLSNAHHNRQERRRDKAAAIRDLELDRVDQRRVDFVQDNGDTLCPQPGGYRRLVDRSGTFS